ncbi:hypothetical protein K438DRAFT_1974907 [Mycena galopus ATCC 62051]|nr:hypothetical protein K438DRAFT_1974907 [Mycena galopus ATCC 62051]
MEDILDAEGRDSEGETASKKAKTAPRKAPKRRRITEPNNTGRSDPEDEDFSASDSNEHDSDLEMVIPNDEIAASLPTKTVPANALRKKPLKPTTGPRKKSKAKSKAVGTLPSESEEPGELVAVPGPSKTKSKGKSRAVDPVPSEPEEQCEPASVPGPPKRKKKQPRSPIHYFFEKVGAADDGLAEEGATYHKCYLGNRTTFRITSGMNHNTSSLLLRPCSSYTIRLRPDPSGSVRTSSVLRPDPRIRLSSLPDASSELRLASVLLAVASGLGR